MLEIAGMNIPWKIDRDFGSRDDHAAAAIPTLPLFWRAQAWTHFSCPS